VGFVNMEKMVSFVGRRSTTKAGGDYAAGGKDKDKDEDSNNYKDTSSIEVSQSMSLSNQVELFLATTPFGTALDVVNLCLSLLSFALYVVVVSQMSEGEEYNTNHDGKGFLQIRNALNAFFIFDYVLNLIAARKKMKFVFSTLGLIDLVTFLPNVLADLPGISNILLEGCFAQCGRSKTFELFRLAGYACAAAAASEGGGGGGTVLDPNHHPPHLPSTCLQRECGDDFTWPPPLWKKTLREEDIDFGGFCLDGSGRDYGLGNFSTPAYSCFDNCPPEDMGAMAFACEVKGYVDAVSAYEAAMNGTACVAECDDVSYIMATGSFGDVCDAFRKRESSKRLKCILRSVAVTLPLLRILRLQRALRLVGYEGMFSLSDLNYQAFSFLLTILSMIAVSSGMVHWAENMSYTCMVNYFADVSSCGKPIKILSFFEALYMIVMTVTTVGYGDFVPKTVPGKLIIIIQMVATLIVIPRETNKILSIIANTSSYSRSRYIPTSTVHVVVCGGMCILSFSFFLTGIYIRFFFLVTVYFCLFLFP
jgi:hypothetical protein